MDKTSLIIVPSVHFKNVKDLLNNKVLNSNEKLVALYNWKSTCEHQEESTAEGMCHYDDEEEIHLLSEVIKAIRTLKELKDDTRLSVRRRFARIG